VRSQQTCLSLSCYGSARLTMTRDAAWSCCEPTGEEHCGEDAVGHADDLGMANDVARSIGPVLQFLALGGLVAALYLLLLPLQSADLRDHFIPWHDALVQYGAAALSGEYADYTPPYLYLLYLVTRLPFDLAPTVAIKLIGIGFTLAGAAAFSGLVRDLTGNRQLALRAGFAFPLLPTIAVNAAWWGQCDIIYTTFLLACFRATLHRRPALAMLMFGLAVSFKLQSVFFAPYLALLVFRREILPRHLAIVPAVFVVAMIPAWIAGRPIAELLTIYFNQGAYEQRLAMNAPNLWMLIGNLPFAGYGPAIVLVGVAAAAAAFLLGLKRATLAFNGTPTMRVVLAVSCLVLAPFLLPKMHDRYFFPADVFSLLLLCLPLRHLRIVPLLVQAASLSVYAAVLAQILSVPLKVQGILLMSAAVAIVLSEFIARTRTVRA
jgi:Gpi18-like mannosyltransferase